jgi:hypothetical protein
MSISILIKIVIVHPIKLLIHPGHGDPVRYLTAIHLPHIPNMMASKAIVAKLIEPLMFRSLPDKER